MQTREEINIVLSESGKTYSECFLWFGKDPETGETSIQKSQAEYNLYVRHLNSLGIEYDEELILENTIGPKIKGIIAVVFKANPENNNLLGARNEFADFFNIEYDENNEFIIIKIHYSPIEPNQL